MLTIESPEYPAPDEVCRLFCFNLYGSTDGSSDPVPVILGNSPPLPPIVVALKVSRFYLTIFAAATFDFIRHHN